MDIRKGVHVFLPASRRPDLKASVKKTVRGTVFSESADEVFPYALNHTCEMNGFVIAHSRSPAHNSGYHSGHSSFLYIKNRSTVTVLLMFWSG